jgi:hypothetical protein
MPEIAWPGEELPPHEQAAVRELVEKGWTYLFCDGEDFAMRAPGQKTQEWWRIDRDGKPVRRRERAGEVVPPPTPLAELLAKLTALAPPSTGVDPHDKTRAPGTTLSQVRSLVRQGYHGRQVTQMTGWGGYWFHDLLDDDGYYNEERERA